MKHILFYSDSREFGGHEVLTLEAVKFLLGCGVRIGFMYFPGNKRLAVHLNELKDSMGAAIDLYPLDFYSRSLQGVRTWLLMSYLRKLKKKMVDIHPDLVVVSQGTIEVSSAGLVAAKAARLKTISYIPFAHKMSTMQAPLATFRDYFNQYYYSLPNRFITSSHRMKELLVEHRVPRENVTVAFNGIDFSRLQQGNRLSLRQQHGINNGDTVAAVVGRILFRQKGHDFLIETLSHFRAELGSLKFVFVGDGPDKKKLERLVASKKMGDLIRFVPWQSDVSLVYPMIDILIIPSHFEGVPVVMQEAMYYKVPIIGSRIDGLEEFLPQDWMFIPRDSKSFMQALARVVAGDNTSLLESNRAFVEREFSVEKFGLSFYEAVMETLNKERA